MVKKNIKLIKLEHNMSNSLARKRRANVPTPPSPAMNPPIPSQVTQEERRPLTLPQILSILDKRLVALEKNLIGRQEEDRNISTTSSVDDTIKATLDEYESRFEMLAEQINNMKDTLMKLQSFTMDVNKTLFEERIQIMQEQSESIHFSGLELNMEGAKSSDIDEEDDEA